MNTHKNATVKAIVTEKIKLMYDSTKNGINDERQIIYLGSAPKKNAESDVVYLYTQEKIRETERHQRRAQRMT